jgi:hypothetical protein
MAKTATYQAKSGASIFDICLQTYSDLNNIYKLIQDNKIESILSSGFSGVNFSFDTNLISDNSIVTKNIKTPYLTELSENRADVSGSYNDDYPDDYDN